MVKSFYTDLRYFNKILAETLSLLHWKFPLLLLWNQYSITVQLCIKTEFSQTNKVSTEGFWSLPTRLSPLDVLAFAFSLALPSAELLQCFREGLCHLIRKPSGSSYTPLTELFEVLAAQWNCINSSRETFEAFSFESQKRHVAPFWNLLLNPLPLASERTKSKSNLDPLFLSCIFGFKAPLKHFVPALNGWIIFNPILKLMEPVLNNLCLHKTHCTLLGLVLLLFFITMCKASTLLSFIFLYFFPIATNIFQMI